MGCSRYPSATMHAAHAYTVVVVIHREERRAWRAEDTEELDPELAREFFIFRIMGSLNFGCIGGSGLTHKTTNMNAFLCGAIRRLAAQHEPATAAPHPAREAMEVEHAAPATAGESAAPDTVLVLRAGQLETGAELLEGPSPCADRGDRAQYNIAKYCKPLDDYI
eukprot:jgi/Tetstr1/455637/TSEL_042448.t1